MLRSLFVIVFLFSFTFAACENDRVPPEEQPPPPPQQEQQQEMPGDPGAVDMDVSDEELEKFVEANMKAQEERLDPQFDRAELEEVIEEAGLDMQQFDEIQMAIQQDPQLQQQVQQKMQEAQEDAYPER
jgi:hypothetical protein